MKAVITSDWHIDARFEHLPRFPEFLDFVSWLETVIEREGADTLLVGGDYFDVARGGVELFWASRLIEIATRLHERVLRSVWIPGNHDAVKHSSGATSLSPLAAVAPRGMYVVERPGLVPWDGPLPLAVLPYPNGARREWRAAEEALVSDLGGVSDLITLSHLSIHGASMGTESHEMARGGDHMFPSEMLRETVSGQILAYNGHYHKPQTIRRHSIDIHIPGSPLRFDAGERGDDCGVLILEV